MNRSAVTAHLAAKRAAAAAAPTQSSSSSSSFLPPSSAKRRRDDQSPRPTAPTPRTAAMIARAAHAYPELRNLLPPNLIPPGDYAAGLGNGGIGVQGEAGSGEDEDEGEEGEDGEEGERSGAGRQTGVMGDSLSWIAAEAGKISQARLNDISPLFSVVKSGYHDSFNATTRRHWRLNAAGDLEIPPWRRNDERSDRLLEKHPSGWSFLFLVFAKMLETEPWLEDEYRRAYESNTPLDSSKLVRVDRPARQCQSAGAYLLRSPSGATYGGMSNMIWLRMEEHGEGSTSPKMAAEKQLHPFSDWSATVLIETDSTPTAVLHIMESILIASIRSSTVTGLNTVVFDQQFPQRSIVPGKYVVALHLAVQAHIQAGRLIPPYPGGSGHKSALYAQQWKTTFGPATDHRFSPSYLYKIVSGRHRQHLTSGLLHLFPIPDTAWAGTAPGVINNGSSGRDVAEYSRAGSRATNPAREAHKRSLGLKTR